jgi:hypothetical protein
LRGGGGSESSNAVMVRSAAPDRSACKGAVFRREQRCPESRLCVYSRQAVECSEAVRGQRRASERVEARRRETALRAEFDPAARQAYTRDDSHESRLVQFVRSVRLGTAPRRRRCARSPRTPPRGSARSRLVCLLLPTGGHRSTTSQKEKARRRGDRNRDPPGRGSAARAIRHSRSVLPRLQHVSQVLSRRVLAAFRLFSTQKQPQRVVLRTESTPPPVVLDTRIRSVFSCTRRECRLLPILTHSLHNDRDVQDEDPEQVEARRKAIASVAVDGQAVRKQAATLPVRLAVPRVRRKQGDCIHSWTDFSSLHHLCVTATPAQSPHPPSYRLSHRVLTPSSYRATKTLQPAPTLIYLDACLPRPLLTLSPFPVPAPEDTEPPKTPHQGLLALPPFEDVYKRRWRETKGTTTRVSGSGQKGDGKKKKAAVKEEEEGRLPRMPKRNRAFELGDGTGHGPLRLSVIYPPPPSPAAAADAVHTNGKSGTAAGPSSNGKASSKGKRLSKARRTREQRRRKQAAAALGV